MIQVPRPVGAAMSLAVAIALLATPSMAFARTSQTFTTLGQSTFTVPAGITQITVEARGGQGGGGQLATCEGGAAADVTGTLNVTPGQVIYVEVGGAGGDSSLDNGYFGGANGGGAGAPNGIASGGGGGASDVRTAPVSDTLNTRGSRLLVAAGGGGGGGVGGPIAETSPGCISTGGSVGGNAVPTAGETSSGTHGGLDGTGGAPGNQINGGAGGGSDGCMYIINGGDTGQDYAFLPNGGQGGFGVGGDGVQASTDPKTATCTHSGGGGGAGYWGGGGGGADQYQGAGGGAGSNYTAPGVTGVSVTQAPFSPYTPVSGKPGAGPPLNGSVTISYGPLPPTSLSMSAPTGGARGTAIAASSVSAVLSDGTSPTGTITFKVFGPQAAAPTDCSGGTTVGTATATGAGTYHPSAAFTPSNAGNYWWYASYGGDANNAVSASACGAAMPETVVAGTATSLSLSVPASDMSGTPIAATSISASLSGGSSPTGTITYRVFGPSSTTPTTCPSTWQLVGTASVNGDATYHPSAGFTPVTGAGNYWWYASYGGDTNTAPSSSTCGTGMALTVVHTATSLSLSAPSTGTAGFAISASSISATLGGGTSPRGNIVFKVFGPQAAAPTDCSTGWSAYAAATVTGNGTYHPDSDFTPGSTGTYWWYATYDGDTINNSSASACGASMGKVVVTQFQYATSVTLTAPATGNSGKTITGSTVSATLTGGNPESNGTVSFKVFGPSASAPTTCTSGGTPLGSETFVGPPSAFTFRPDDFTPSVAGNYWWYASYSGDANDKPSASPCGAAMPETVVANGGGGTPTSLTMDAVGVGTAGTAIPSTQIFAMITATSAPTSTITFKVFGPQASAPTNCSAGTTVGTATAHGDGTYNPSAGFTPPSAGNYWWYSTYAGDTQNASSGSTCGAGMAETVVAPKPPVQTSLVLFAPPSGTQSTAIGATSITAFLTGGSSPTGTITFRVFGPSSTTPTTCPSTWPLVGTASVSANGTYHPSAGFTPMSDSGNYWWYASYDGDAGNIGSNSTCGSGMAETVVSGKPTTMSLTVPAAGTEGTAIPGTSITATLSGGSSPTGGITFHVFGPQQTAPTTCSTGWKLVDGVGVSGNGTYHPAVGFTPVTGAGNYWWYADYGGDSKNAGSSSTCGAGMAETVVSAATTTVSVNAPATGAVGSTVSATDVSAALSGAASPGGTITFTVFGPQDAAPTDCSSGGTTVGTAGVTDNGTYHPSAAFRPSDVGHYWWYASYSGDAGNSGSQSACGAGMPETVISAAPSTTSLSLSAPSTGTVGKAIATSAVSAVLSGGSSPTGTVTFTVFGPQAAAPTDCTTGGTTAGTASVTNNGVVHPSSAFTPTLAGSYWWYVRYGGDAGNAGSHSGCGAGMPETVVSAASGGKGGTGTARLGSVSVSGMTLTLPVSCSLGGPCTVNLRLIVIETIRNGKIIAVAAGHKTVTIGQTSARVNAGGHARVQLRLNRTGRTLLAHHSPLYSLLVVSAGGRTIAKKHVMFRRPHRAR